MFITSCSESNVIEFLSDDRLLLNNRHKSYLEAICETFLPVSGISEKVGRPVDYILAMLNDCHEPEEVHKFAIGFDQYKLLMTESSLKIRSSDPEEIITVVESTLAAEIPREELVFFINKMKSLSIRYFISSEYYMIEYREYQLIPQPFEGCAPVS